MSDALQQFTGFSEVPTSIFVQRVDISMPELPPIDLFVAAEGATAPRLLRKADQPYSPLALTVHPTVWVRDQDLRTIRGQTEMLLSDSRLLSAMPLEKRLQVVRKASMLVLEDLFENPSDENIKRSTKVVSSFVYILMKDPKAYLPLSRLSSHDPYTLQHSVGTAVNTIILSQHTGIGDERELFDIGMAGLLHDVGKVKVRREIINKEGPLDDLEWEEMRTHSSEGYELVKNQTGLSERTKRAILEHHEDKIGTGYPSRLKPTETDPFSKIVCICDVYNALTTNRSYSSARTPFEAFKLMREKLTHKIDDELFRHLVLIYGGDVK